MNEVRAGVRATPPEKPEILRLYDLMNLMKVPLRPGGLFDQPHLLVLRLSSAVAYAQFMETIISKDQQ